MGKENKKIGYKSVKPDMSAYNGVKYEVGPIYYIEDKELKKTDENVVLVDNGKELRTCTKDVIHYYEKLEDLGVFYPIRNSRHFEVEILGKTVTKPGKSGTTALRFIKEITKEVQSDYFDRYLNLNLVKKLQERFPDLILGGSLGLYLQDIKIPRMFRPGASSDLDLIHPYYINIPDELKYKGEIYLDIEGSDEKIPYKINKSKDLPSGCDFGEQFYMDEVKIDVAIDPEAKYSMVGYKGFKYKVIPWEIILKYKLKYALKGGKSSSKHKNDLYELLTK